MNVNVIGWCAPTMPPRPDAASALALVLDMDNTLIDCANWIRRPDGTFEADVPIARPHLEALLAYAFEHACAVGIWTSATDIWYARVNAEIFAPTLERISARLGRPCAFDFVYTRRRCTRSVAYAGGYFGCMERVRTTKRLRKLWRVRTGIRAGITRDNTLILDDSPSVYVDNYGNGVPVPAFDLALNAYDMTDRREYYDPDAADDDDDDDTLLRLVTYLREVHAVFLATGTVRHIDKRYWAR